MKRPAFQFYPADWRKDVELRSCSIAARGLWIDLLCIAHECEPYGYLTVNGKAMNAGQIAGQVGITRPQCAALLQELLDNGVARTNRDGVIYSKRMVDDEQFRETRAEIGRANGAKGAEFGSLGAEHGKKGGRPRNENPDENPAGNPPKEPAEKPPQNPRPSSSSSSSSSEEKTPTPSGRGTVHGFPPGFERLWAAYPRKVGKVKAAHAFAKLKPDVAMVDAMVTAVEAQRQSEQWRKDGGRFVPHPTTWLNEGRWLDESTPGGADVFAGAK